ncbi:MAG: NADH-quinone oxidoreductase subunit I [Verrucomicrobia bacterium]|nr:NADH-quinone oxidoreductase subunit I [Verrucomicrobiota bacterium]
MKEYLQKISGGLYSLVQGMRITLEQFFKPVVTVNYPHESLKMTPRFRGHIELVRDPKTGKAICFACKVCEKACPSDCIIVEGAKKEGEKRKSVTEFKLDFTKCSLCGSCVESCKSNALQFSKEYNLASTRKEDFIMDLFKRLEAQRVGAEPPVASPTPPEQPKPEPVAAQPTTEAP